MVDFDTNGRLLKGLGVEVVAASVDSVADTTALADGLRLGYVQALAELDGPAVAEATGAALQTGDRTFLHATAFVLDPEGTVAQSVYSSGPIGRFTANDILKWVSFVQAQSAG